MRVWDASTGGELKTLNGHTDSVRSVAFSRDGTRIVSGSEDRSVRVWDMLYHDQHWVSTPDNWIISFPDSQRLMWIPSEIKQVLCYPPSLLKMSLEASASLNFKYSKVGPEWSECCASSESAY